jgi:uncharacterized membrane protein
MYAVTAIAAGLTLPRIESHVFPELSAAVSVPVAMVVYTSIASGMISLMAIVFSLTFVMTQVSATAYSPRLVLWLVRDPLLSHALGVFTATFLYAIAALAWVDRSGSGKVPFLSAWLVVALLLASMGMFIGLIQRIGLLQVNRMLTFTSGQGRQVITKIYSHGIALLRQKRVSEIGGPLDILCQLLDQVGKLRWGLDTRVPVLLHHGLGETLAF